MCLLANHMVSAGVLNDHAKDAGGGLYARPYNKNR